LGRQHLPFFKKGIFMKRRVAGVVCGVMGCVMGLWELGCQQQPPQQSQWQTLFDGSDVKAWRGINMATFPEAGWVIEDGSLVRDPSKGSSRDIITRDQYGDFELALEFRLTEAANSGIKYLVVESLSRGGSGLGPEYQILDDQRHPDARAGRDGNRTLASLYDILPARDDKPVKPIGQWNTARIVSRQMHVEHWLNGMKVLEYKRDDPAFRQKVAQSKFKDIPDFALAPKGHILLQDHGDKVYFRNIRIREL
jgi:hypothetical protein